MIIRENGRTLTREYCADCIKEKVAGFTKETFNIQNNLLQSLHINKDTSYLAEETEMSKTSYI